MTIRNLMERAVEIGEGDKKKVIDIVVKKPNNDVVKRAERYKSKVWNESVQEGVLTKKELKVLMEKRGVWDESKDSEEKAISKIIVDLEKTLYHGDGKKKPKLSEGRDIAIQIRRERIKLRDLFTERLELEENTADNLADNARFDFLVAHCTFHKNGQPYYKDFQDYDSRSADEVAFSAASCLSEMLYNIDSSFEKGLPENQFLTKYKLVDESLSLIDPNNSDQLIDTDGRRIDESGYYLDADGNRTDIDGHPLTEDGQYVLTDYDNDLVDTKKKATKKKELPDTTDS